MKKFIALLLSLAMVLSLCSLTACGKRGGEGDTNKDGDTADAKYTLTIGHVYTEDSIEHKQMAKIKELVEEKTNGACQVKIFANEQLGDEQNIAEQCVTGACDMGFSEGSVWATVTNKPEFAVFGLPFQYSNIDAAKEVTANLIRPELNKIADGTGLYVLGNVYSGFRHMLSVKSPIKTLDDLKGMKIRVQQTEVAISMVRALGAEATPMDYAEVFQGLQTGIVDGAENDFVSYYTSGHYEVAKYYSLDQHMAPPAVLLMSKASWDKMTEAQQEAVRKAAYEAAVWQRQAMQDYQLESRAACEAAGCEIIEVDVPSFQAAVASVYDEYPQYKTIVDMINAVE